MFRLSDTGPFIINADEWQLAPIKTVLAKLPAHLLDLLRQSDTRIYFLRVTEKYRDASRSLRRLGVDCDVWPVPPAGLFVVEERTVYVRTPTPMTLAHELFHAIDAALGGGVYRSGYDPQIRAAFANARSFVTPYAATGLDEYMAESGRAYIECNDKISPWPAATRARLKHIDPAMYAVIEAIFTAPKPTQLPLIDESQTMGMAALIV